jgi:hypothetical protein
LTEAGDAFGAPAGVKLLRGNGAVATVTVKIPLWNWPAVVEAPAFTVRTSVPAPLAVVKRNSTGVPGLTIFAILGAVGKAIQVPPLLMEYWALLPPPAREPQISEGAFVPVKVTVGFAAVTVSGVVLSVFGAKVKPSGTRSITKVKQLWRPVLEIRQPLRVPVGNCPQAPGV